MAEARLGDVVQVRFNCLHGSGTVISMSETDPPLEFMVGSERAIKGISKAVVGMRAGEHKTVTVPAEEGFGAYNPKLVFRIRRAALPSDARIGDPISAQVGEKDTRVWITALDDEFATVDGNHPLAGQTIVLQVWLVGIRATAAQHHARPTPTASAAPKSQSQERRRGSEPGQRHRRRTRP
jgi:peptidylprolyl isomerase